MYSSHYSFEFCYVCCRSGVIILVLKFDNLDRTNFNIDTIHDMSDQLELQDDIQEHWYRQHQELQELVQLGQRQEEEDLGGCCLVMNQEDQIHKMNFRTRKELQKMMNDQKFSINICT